MQAGQHSSRRRRVAVVLVDRANYGRLKPVMLAIDEHDALELSTVVTGSMLLERFGLPVRAVEADGFRVDIEVHVELEGSTPTTMAKSLGIAVMEITTALRSVAPDVVLLIGDRYEALAAALAAAYQNVPVAHVQGGEVSGSIDESARHAITKFAQLHFPSTRRSAEFLVRMGERPDTVFLTGCPSGDLIRSARGRDLTGAFEAGVGARVDPADPYALVIFHPVTTQFDAAESQVAVVLEALDEIGMPTVWQWPNIDAGGDHISKVLRRFREDHEDRWLHLVKWFPPDQYEAVLANAAVAVGNSSSFVRDSSFLGTPVVLVGDRQAGRETAENVVHADVDRAAIVKACREQISHGRFAPSELYGKGDAAEKIVSVLATAQLQLQKQLHYVDRGEQSDLSFVDLTSKGDQ